MPSRSRSAARRRPSLTRKTRTRTTRPATRAAKSVTVRSWEDDPGDPRTRPALEPIAVKPPSASAAPYPFAVTEKAPAAEAIRPARRRFVTSLRRPRFVAPRTSGVRSCRGTSWQVGARLPVRIDDGVDLNAFYTRGDDGEAPGLHFFHASVGGRVFFWVRAPTSRRTKWGTPCWTRFGRSSSTRRASRRRPFTSRSAT